MNDLARLLKGMKHKPCACGKRTCGDRVTPVSEPKRTELVSFFQKATAARIECDLRCDVCGHVELAFKITTEGDQ